MLWKYCLMIEYHEFVISVEIFNSLGLLIKLELFIIGICFIALELYHHLRNFRSLLMHFITFIHFLQLL